jgi:hypothetical protein
MSNEKDTSIPDDTDTRIGFGIIRKVGTGITDSFKNIANLPAAAVEKASEALDWVTENAKLFEKKTKQIEEIANIPIEAAGRVASKGFEASPGGLVMKKVLDKIPAMPQLPQVPALPTATPKTGGSNNQIGGLKRLVNEKKTIVKRIARTMKLFNRTNTRKRGRKGKSKRVRFAL